MDKKQIVKDVAMLLLAAAIGAGVVFARDTYKYAKLAKFLTDNECEALGPPKPGSVAADYFSEGFQCGPVVAVIPRR